MKRFAVLSLFALLVFASISEARGFIGFGLFRRNVVVVNNVQPFAVQQQRVFVQPGYSQPFAVQQQFAPFGVHQNFGVYGQPSFGVLRGGVQGNVFGPSFGGNRFGSRVIVVR